MATILAISNLLLSSTYASFNEFIELRSSNHLSRAGKKAILNQAISDCQQFIDFEEDLYEFALKMNKEQPGYIINPKGFKKNMDSQKAIKNILQNFNLKSSDPEKLLSDLLEMRFSFLDNRKKFMELTRKKILEARNDSLMKDASVNERHPIYGPTHPKFFEELSPHMKFLAQSSTDRYQLINKIIVTVWQLIDPRALRAQTKLQVRCSTSLWANFTGEREYLGHPDEAILIYENEYLPFNKDQSNFDTYLRVWPANIELLGWTKGQIMDILWTPYERSLWDKSWSEYGRIEEAPYPEWLKPRYQNFPKPQTPAEVGNSSKQGSKHLSLEKKKSHKRSKTKRTPRNQVIQKKQAVFKTSRVISIHEAKEENFGVLPPLKNPERPIISEEIKEQLGNDKVETENSTLQPDAIELSDEQEDKEEQGFTNSKYQVEPSTPTRHADIS